MIHCRRAILLFAANLMIFNLSACAPEDPNAVMVEPKPNLGQTTTSREIEENTNGQGSIKAQLSETPDYISQVFSDNFVVKADVHVPMVDKADVLYAKYMSYDEEKLLSIFYKGKKPQRSTNNVDSTITYRDDNSELTISDSYIAYQTRDYDYVKYPIDNFAPASDIFSSYEHFGNVYTKENLEFMAKSEVFSTVSNILSELSVDLIEDMKETEIYAIDFSTMQKWQDEMIQKDIDRQNEMGFSSIKDSTVGYQMKDTFTPEDEFYLLFFRMKQNDIPVTQKSYIVQATERFLNGSTARVAFSHKGIIQINLNGIYQQEGVAESPNKLISVEEALQKAYEDHNSIISTDKATITAIDFEYVPVPYNKNYDEVKLTPAWCLTVAYEVISDKPLKDGKTDSKPNARNRMMFINAITGKRIQ